MKQLISESNEKYQKTQIQSGEHHMYAKEIFGIALYDISIGININRRRINIRFADDTIIFTNNLEDLQILMDMVTQVS